VDKCIPMRLRIPWFPARKPTLLTIAVLIILAAPHIASPATFTVNRTTDFADAIPGDGRCETAPGNGLCTLRAAIEEINALDESNILTDPQSMINLPAGTYRLTRGELEITVSLALQGAGPNSTIIDGDHQFRVFLISKGKGGQSRIASISGVKVTHGSVGFAGGGISIDSETNLSLSNCIVSDNSAEDHGGGINNLGSLVITNCIVSNNSSTGEGTGIANGASGFLQIVDSTIRDNIGTPSDPQGGGLFTRGGGIANSGTAEIHRSTISGNLQNRGGGIYNEGHLEITNSTISGNKANVGGGGILNFGDGIVSIDFSTITNNEAALQGRNEPENRVGGGILNCYTLFGDLTCGTLVAMSNTILAGNTDHRDDRADPLYSPDCFSLQPEQFIPRFESFHGNLIGVINQNCKISDAIFAGQDLVGTADNPRDPRLEPLANKGGLTQTHALLRDSPAIDQGTGVSSVTLSGCPATDQRSFTRPVDGDRDGTADCDIGAFEFGAVPPEISFQDGVSPTPAYAGTQDAYIAEEEPTTNFCSVPTLRVDGDDPPGTGRELRTLIRWDLSDIPAGSEVTSATITINVTNPTVGTYELYAISSPWEECQVTWNDGPGRGNVLRGTVGPASMGTHTIILNNDGVTLVQAWIDGFTPNHGLMMVGSDVTDGLGFNSREASPASNRPRLTITFD
jgi:hypothetical protein